MADRRSPAWPLVPQGKGDRDVIGTWGFGGPRVRNSIFGNRTRETDRGASLSACEGEDESSPFFVCRLSERLGSMQAKTTVLAGSKRGRMVAGEKQASHKEDPQHEVQISGWRCRGTGCTLPGAAEGKRGGEHGSGY